MQLNAGLKCSFKESTVLPFILSSQAKTTAQTNHYHHNIGNFTSMLLSAFQRFNNIPLVLLAAENVFLSRRTKRRSFAKKIW
jgi:hypothetical protein